MFVGGRPNHLFRRANLRESRLKVRPALQSLLQALLNRDRLRRLIGNFLGECEILSERQTDNSGKSQLLLGKIIPRYNELLAAALEFHLGPQHINARRNAHVSHI